MIAALCRSAEFAAYAWRVSGADFRSSLARIYRFAMGIAVSIIVGRIVISSGGVIRSHRVQHHSHDVASLQLLAGSLCGFCRGLSRSYYQ